MNEYDMGYVISVLKDVLTIRVIQEDFYIDDMGNTYEKYCKVQLLICDEVISEDYIE